MSRGGRALGVRWTIGDVSGEGFEALRLAVWGAWRMFEEDAAYAICVNSVPVDEARRRTGELPPGVTWQQVSAADLPGFFARYLDQDMAEGVAWKFAPLRIFPDRHELSFDNDCILWRVPRAIAAWLAAGLPEQCVLAEDVRACFGRYAPFCGDAPRNLGIRGLPPGYDLGAALEAMLRDLPVKLESELDEQGLQVAALSRAAPPLAVTVEDVTICSPFPPHLPGLGACGAHFVGLNAHRLPWQLDGREATDLTREHWRRLRGAVAARVGVCL